MNTVFPTDILIQDIALYDDAKIIHYDDLDIIYSLLESSYPAEAFLLYPFEADPYTMLEVTYNMLYGGKHVLTDI